MPFFAPASMAMFAMVNRCGMESLATTSPQNSSAAYSAPSTPISPMSRRIRSLPPTSGRRVPVYSTRIVGGTRSQVSPVAITAAKSVLPTPVEKAPRAP